MPRKPPLLFWKQLPLLLLHLTSLVGEERLPVIISLRRPHHHRGDGESRPEGQERSARFHAIDGPKRRTCILFMEAKTRWQTGPRLFGLGGGGGASDVYGRLWRALKAPVHAFGGSLAAAAGPCFHSL